MSFPATPLLPDLRSLPIPDYGTWKATLLFSVLPAALTTSTSPVVAPVGTVAVISVLEATVKVAATPLKVTLVAPVRLFPRILTADATLPEVGRVSTYGPRPMDKLKTVPLQVAQLW